MRTPRKLCQPGIQGIFLWYSNNPPSEYVIFIGRGVDDMDQHSGRRFIAAVHVHFLTHQQNIQISVSRIKYEFQVSIMCFKFQMFLLSNASPSSKFSRLLQPFMIHIFLQLECNKIYLIFFYGNDPPSPRLDNCLKEKLCKNSFGIIDQPLPQPLQS